MGNWRASLGFLALIAVLLAVLLPLPGQGPAIRVGEPARGAPSPSPSAEIFQGMISVEGKQVPLPPGEWRIAGRAISGLEPASMLSITLVRLDKRMVDGAVLIQTNRLDSNSLWGLPSQCSRSDLYYASVSYASDHDGSCAYAAFVDTAVPRYAADASWQAAVLGGVGQGWRFRRFWMQAAYRITDPRDALEVRYLFPAPDRVDDGVAQSLVAWTKASAYAIGSGFRNRLGSDASLPDWPAPRAATNAQIPDAAGSASYWDRSIAALGSAFHVVEDWTSFGRGPVLVGDLPGAGSEGVATDTLKPNDS